MKIGKIKCADGLTLFANAIDGDAQFQARIWRNLRGITFRKIANEKVVSSRVQRGNYNGYDYATIGTLLRAEYSLD